MTPLIITGILPFLLAGLFLRGTVWSGYRLRRMKWRIRFRLQPGPGFASLAELMFRWGRLAALSHGRRIRPDMTLRQRLRAPTTDYAVRLGRAQYGRRVYARGEDQVLVLAPQRVGKSGLLADRILSHPGPLLATTTRGDLYKITGAARSALGPVEVFNPQGTAGIRSTFSWDLLEPCRDPVMADQMAGWLTGGAAAREDHGNLEWFENAGSTALAACLWAAAVGGYDVTDIFRWIHLDGHQAALQLLATHQGSTPEMRAVAKRVFENNRTADSIRSTMAMALAWVMIPGLKDAVTPGRGRGFDLDEFLDSNGSVYLVASGDEDSPLSPLFRCFASWLHWSCGLAGTLRPDGRLPVPLLEALDELAVICPVDLPAMLADSAGKGIQIVAVAHSRSQLARRWGEHGAATIWALTGTKILLTGTSDAATLKDVSEVSGTVAIGEDETRTVPVVPPELLRTLPDGRALVLRLNLNPVIVKFRPAWKRRDYRRLSRAIPVSAPVPAADLVLTDAELARFFDRGPESDRSAS